MKKRQVRRMHDIVIEDSVHIAKYKCRNSKWMISSTAVSAFYYTTEFELWNIPIYGKRRRCPKFVQGNAQESYKIRFFLKEVS